MGLDMYLKAANHIADYDFLPDQEREAFRKVVDAMNAKAILSPEFPSADVAITVAYWRKANAIHGWFIKNCAQGKDECQDIYVSREALETLQKTCQEVLMDKTKAQELLPVTQGFFFGSYDYDEWYYGYVAETEQRIGVLLKSVGADWHFIYRSSW